MNLQLFLVTNLQHTIFLLFLVLLQKIKVDISAYPAAGAHFFTLVKLEETSGVAAANICEVNATTPLGFVWPNISTPLTTVFLMSRWWCGDVQWH